MRAIYHPIKSGLIAAFFVLPIWLVSAADMPQTNKDVDRLMEKAIAEEIYKLPGWSALLHSKNGYTNISDPQFLLSYRNFSLASELKQTINFLYEGNPNNVCRFPARYYWLRQHLDIPELPLDACPDVLEFRQKSPLNNISIVFASESVSQPASMLGHSFLKLSGKDNQGKEVTHAITFYTDVNTYNLPKLLFDSLIIGKQGYFALAPYAEMQQRYVDNEQRNLWEYTLLLNDFQIELIRLHLLELKDTKLTYFFQKYNCATLLNFVLSLTDKSMPDNVWWLTPKDLIKNAQHAGLINSTRIVTPSRWLYRAIATQIPLQTQRTIRQKIIQGEIDNNFFEPNNEASFIQLELARAYNQYAYHAKELNNSVWAENENSLSKIKEHFFTDMLLSSNDKKNPINTPEDRQVSLSTQNDNGEQSLILTALPVSHTLLDDNRGYAAESSLQLFSTSLKAPFSGGQLSLNQLVFFDMKSLMPYDEFTGGKSGQLHIAIEPHKNSQLENIQVFTTSGALGITNRIVPDVDLFSFLGGGVDFQGQSGLLYTTIEAGTIIREVWDMKSLLSITRTDNQIDQRFNYYTVWLSHSKFISRNNTINLDWKLDVSETSRHNLLSLTLKNIF